MKRQSLQLLAAALFLGSTAFAQASDNAAVIFPAEGNKTCNDYAANSMIYQMSTNSPLAVGSLSGPENPMDADNNGESASYTVEAGTLAGFKSTTPIDFALLKSNRNIALIIYPSGGVVEDSNMKLTIGGVDQNIASISLCYGLGNVAPPPPPEPEVFVVPTCEDLNAAGGLDGVQVMCPTDGSRSIVANFELEKDAPFYNTNGTYMACVCNNFDDNGAPQPLKECDPNVPYLEVEEPAGSGYFVPVDNNACPKPGMSKSGAEVTTHIELNNDPYYCTTSGGIRRCYAY